MPARREIRTFGPEELKLHWTAFDDAWTVVKMRYEGNAQCVEVGRLRPANAVLSAYRDGLVDPDLIAAQALDVLDGAFPDQDSATAMTSLRPVCQRQRQRHEPLCTSAQSET